MEKTDIELPWSIEFQTDTKDKIVRIVKSVNNYDAVLNALDFCRQQLAACLETAESTRDWAEIEGVCNAAIGTADNALSLAKGE